MKIGKITGFKITLAAQILSCLLLDPDNLFSQDSIPVNEPGYIVISGGIYSCLDLWASTGFAGAQVLPGLKLWVLQPQIGALVSYTGAFMVYAGMVWPAKPVNWLVIQTGAAMGYYESGEGVNLAFPLEFRLSLSILYNFRNSSRLGLEFAHISNANLGPPNPGTESISVIFQFPLRSRKTQSRKF